MFFYLLYKNKLICYNFCMKSFDDFVKINGDEVEVFINLAQRYVKIFLNKINAKKVDDLLVKFVPSPFLDIVYIFRINGQIVYLDQSYIKQKSLHEQYDSALATIFSELSQENIKDICLTLTQMLKQKYIKKTTKTTA